MLTVSSPAIVLHRADFGDFDLIVTLFTLEKGKITAIAKSAKKSIRRFSGVLEPFSFLEVVLRGGQKKGMPILQEASLKHPFLKIREQIQKMAYAGYWAELVKEWSEEGEKQAALYELLLGTLEALDEDRMQEETLSLFFQIRFLTLAGLQPNLDACRICHIDLEKVTAAKVVFHVAKGGVVCEKCPAPEARVTYLSKGTLKQLQRLGKTDLRKASRARLSGPNIQEAQELLEAFIPYHLGKSLKSLRVLKQLRRQV